MLSRGLAVKGSDGVVSRIAGSQTDISDRKATEAKLIHDAFYDRLTNLPNRALFMDRLKSAIERTKRREDYIFAVLFLDLDQFKNVNDTLGHPVGDQLLIAIGSILKTNLRATDTVARLGGDEFVILLEDIKNTTAAVSISEWIMKKLSAPIRLAENEVFVTTSIGIVLSTLSYSHPEDMLRDADIAMYAAKAQGKATYKMFNPAMRERILNRVSLEADLRHAVDNSQILTFYQPIVSFETGELVGFEVLAHWQHPERGLIPPSEFIPLAQETGLIVPIDRWVLEEACRQTQEWQTTFQFLPPLNIHVNLADHMIAQADLIESIQTILQNTGLENQRLGLEITESTVVANSEAMNDIIKALREMDIEILIDDFGTGYSSLANLQKFPITALKIDYTFIRQMREGKNNNEIVRTVIDLAHDLGLSAYAEGIETEVELTQLKKMGCDFGQGFLFSKPLSAEAIAEMLEDSKSKSGTFAPWNELLSGSG
jgi:diguanylate cyclase (GGDEF)-like protein